MAWLATGMDLWTRLRTAALHGHIDVIKDLIREGAEVNEEDNRGETVLHHAAENGHIDVIRYLIRKGAEVNEEDNRGAEINKGDKDSRAALHYAVENAHYDVIKYLISQGADVNKRTANGWTVLHCAATNCSFGVIEYLLKFTGEVNRNAEDQHALLPKGDSLEVNKADNEGRTALHIAVQHGYIDVVKFLLTSGALSDTEDIRGQTPLHQSITLGHRDIAGLLIDKLNAKNDSVAIHLAVMYGLTSIIERMIAKGSDINVQSNDGQTCLHKAIKLCYQKKQNVEGTETLRKVSEKYYSGRLSPEKALVFYLLEHGARIDIKDGAGCLPIHYAKDEMIRQMILAR
nr:putative ankyrin repeat protein RF_0381 [Lytechinus pictus]